MHLYSASWSAQQSEALPVRETRAVLRERKEALCSPANQVDMHTDVIDEDGDCDDGDNDADDEDDAVATDNDLTHNVTIN